MAEPQQILSGSRLDVIKHTPPTEISSAGDYRAREAEDVVIPQPLQGQKAASNVMFRFDMEAGRKASSKRGQGGELGTSADL